MRESQQQPQPAKVNDEWPWLDIAAVIVITVLTILVSAHFELNEALYSVTRRWEHFQVDELPLGMLVLSVGLIWLSWRRFQHARRELRARRIAEARLALVLAENRELTQENLRIQEVERKHLARELHDELGQYLNAIKLDAVSICDSRARDAEFSTNASLAIIRSADHVHRAVSDMIGRLRPVGLDELGLVAAIEHCVDQWRQRLPNTRFLLSVTGDFDDLSESLTLTLFRLIQEGLTNVYKHASATQVGVCLQRGRSDRNGGDELRLTVTDDGCGMESNARVSRFGLSGMRERVEMSGGTFSLDSAPGRGLRFEALFPVREEL
jgi:two-component system, NarL family, sensor histidine kinase UhpB